MATKGRRGAKSAFFENCGVAVASFRQERLRPSRPRQPSPWGRPVTRLTFVEDDAAYPLPALFEPSKRQRRSPRRHGIAVSVGFCGIATGPRASKTARAPWMYPRALSKSKPWTKHHPWAQSAGADIGFANVHALRAKRHLLKSRWRRWPSHLGGRAGGP